MKGIRAQMISLLLILVGTSVLVLTLTGIGNHSLPAGERLMLLAAGVTAVCCLVLLPTHGSATGNGLLAGIAFLTLGATGVPGQLPLLLKTATGTAILLFTLTAATGLMNRLMKSPDAAAWTIMLLTGLLSSITIWSGPMLDLLAPGKPAVDVIVASSPLTYLASLAEWDYLRGEWFYRHTPFGGLRYDYPSSFTGSLVCLGIGLACRLATSRLENASFRGPVSSLPQSLPH